MPEIYSKPLNKTISTDRIIGRLVSHKPGPNLIFFAGIHGNEPSGVFALKEVIKELKAKNTTLNGNLIAISGNLWALEKSVRYHKTDLNRIWNKEKVKTLSNGSFVPKNEDEKQQQEIYKVIKDILTNEPGPFYFFDLHTTSCNTIPFITVNDSLLNRRFTKQYPVPLVLGIEEYLEGPLLSYINEQGYISFGFEAGQHNALDSIENHKIFVYLSLALSGVINKKDIDFDHYIETWKKRYADHQSFYEIYNRYEVNEKDHFAMKPGFSNFQKINRGDVLATSNKKAIYSKENTTIFMPLYQSQGNDGYFFIRKIPKFFLGLSSLLRKLKADRFLLLMPGIQWASPEKESMIVNLRTARLLTKQILHLLGYRSKEKDKDHLLIKNRESKSKFRDYKKEAWYRNKRLS